jgi:hypothetical protein
MLEQRLEVAQLLVAGLVGAAHHDRVAGLAGDSLHAAHDLAPERVADVEHHHAEHAARAGAQLARRAVADEVQLRHRPLHARERAGRDELRVVEDVRDRPDRHARERSDLADAR